MPYNDGESVVLFHKQKQKHAKTKKEVKNFTAKRAGREFYPNNRH